MFTVCYIVDAPYAGGAERYISLLARGLDKERFKATVIIRSGTDLADWSGELEDSGIEVIETRMNLPYTPRYALGILGCIRRVDPHIVHLNMPGPYDAQMGLLAPLSRVAGSTRILVTEHLPMVEKLWKRAMIKKFSYLFVDEILTVCRSNVYYLQRYQSVPPEKISVVYNALPRGYGLRKTQFRGGAREKLGIGKGTVAVCIVGSLIKRKGHSVLIEALSLLPDLPWRLVVIGEGEERRPCEEKISCLGLRERTVFLGTLPNPEVEKVLCGMDILALPSFMEAMPYAILEAMACALPVVASSVFGIPEVAADGETAILVPPGSVCELREALGRLIREESLRTRLGNGGRKRFLEHFTLDKQIEDIQSIYLRTLNG